MLGSWGHEPGQRPLKPDFKDPLTYPELLDKILKIREDNAKKSSEALLNPQLPKLTVTRKIDLGRGKWQYYYHKTGNSYGEGSYLSGEADSLVPGKNNAPDTIFEKTYSSPIIPKYDIPKQ